MTSSDKKCKTRLTKTLCLLGFDIKFWLNFCQFANVLLSFYLGIQRPRCDVSHIPDHPSSSCIRMPHRALETRACIIFVENKNCLPRIMLCTLDFRDWTVYGDKSISTCNETPSSST